MPSEYDRKVAEAAIAFDLHRRSVKEQEANFVKAIPKGLASSTLRTFGALTDLVGITEGAEKDIRNHWEDKISDAPGSKAGFDFANVLGDVSQVVLDPATGVAKGAVKAGLMLGVTDKTGRIAPKLANAVADATDAFKTGSKTAMQVWKEHGLVNLNFGVKDAPIELARYLPMNELRIAEGSVVDASGLERTLAQALVDSKERGMNISTVLAGTKLFDDDEYRWLFDRSLGGQGYKLVLDDTLLSNQLGYHDAYKGVIGINRKLFDDKTGQFTDTGIRTLAHELQHAIQFGEDWAGKGSNLKAAKQQIDSVENALVQRFGKVQKLGYDKLNAIMEKSINPTLGALQKRFEALPENVKAALIKYGADPTIAEIDTPEARQYLREAFSVVRALRESPLVKVEQDLSRLGVSIRETELKFDGLAGLTTQDVINRSKFNLDVTPLNGEYVRNALNFKFYENDIGEVWARVASDTHHMSAEDMAASAPWRFITRSSPRVMSSKEDYRKGFWGELFKEEEALLNPAK